MAVTAEPKTGNMRLTEIWKHVVHANSSVQSMSADRMQVASVCPFLQLLMFGN
jgi:hypothetical protein